MARTEWSDTSTPAKIVSRPGDVRDENGEMNWGTALVVPGAVIEAETKGDLVKWLEAALAELAAA